MPPPEDRDVEETDWDVLDPTSNDVPDPADVLEDDDWELLVEDVPDGVLELDDAELVTAEPGVELEDEIAVDDSVDDVELLRIKRVRGEARIVRYYIGWIRKTYLAP
ncbi:hypothetical protein MMC24_006194 [Lignoscripta atroalba]|nr:hypothetical protein [Lignoscripta atroalba]